ncbi:hypothetical protein AVEN_82703-1 [Araneus ventricosus]|uniref:Uncharacterized protein n=1 Tax=Araneus ventricosus TaxID=182803 RepID=A0A4Y2SYT6_ARAVE|nr:hypothetical protein AVEN_82703-1 [Araneus ventricosus]
MCTVLTNSITSRAGLLTRMAVLFTLCMDRSPAQLCSGERTIDGVWLLQQDDVVRTGPERWDFPSSRPRATQVCLKEPPAESYPMLCLVHTGSYAQGGRAPGGTCHMSDLELCDRWESVHQFWSYTLPSSCA